MGVGKTRRSRATKNNSSVDEKTPDNRFPEIPSAYYRYSEGLNEMEQFLGLGMN